MQRAASKSVLLGISHLCDEIQRSEVLDLSTQFQQLFHEFNLQYFAGRLPNYKVRVVYDIAEWAGPDGDFGALATHQPELRRIFIRVTDRLPPMATVLLAEMACLIRLPASVESIPIVLPFINPPRSCQPLQHPANTC
jgi:hypothetical protein